MFNFKNKEKEEILLIELNHILLNVGDNELDLTQRRVNIAKQEIEKRKLKIEIINLGDKDALQTNSETETKKQKFGEVVGDESSKDRSGDGNKL